MEETGVTAAALNAWLSDSLPYASAQTINQRMKRFIQRIHKRQHAFDSIVSRYAPSTSRVATPAVSGEDLVTLNIAVSATLDAKTKLGCGVTSYADSVLWNRHENEITPRRFLEQTCRDLRVEPEIFLDKLEQQMKEQLNYFNQIDQSKTKSTQPTNSQSMILENVSSSPYIAASPFPTIHNAVQSSGGGEENVFDRNRNFGGRFLHRERDADAPEEQEESNAAEENEEREEEKASETDESDAEAEEADANEADASAASGERNFVRLEIDVVCEGSRVQQYVLWDRTSKLISPEEFAQTFCSELSTSAEFLPKVAVQIREQLQFGLNLKNRPLKTYAVPPSVEESIMKPAKAMPFTPQIYPLTVRASIAAFQRPPRPYVAHYTSENQRHALMVGPLIDGNEGRRKAIEKGYMTLDNEMKEDEEEDKAVLRPAPAVPRGRPPKAYFAAALASAYVGQPTTTTTTTTSTRTPSAASSAYAARRAKKAVAKPKPRYFVLVATESFIRLRDANSMRVPLVPVTEPIIVSMNTNDDDEREDASSAVAVSSAPQSHKRKRGDPRSPAEEVEPEGEELNEKEDEDEPRARFTISINKKRMQVARTTESPQPVTPFTIPLRRASRRSSRSAAAEEEEPEEEVNEEEDEPAIAPFSIRRPVSSQASPSRASPEESPILFVTPDFLVLKKAMLKAAPQASGRTRRR